MWCSIKTTREGNVGEEKNVTNSKVAWQTLCPFVTLCCVQYKRPVWMESIMRKELLATDFLQWSINWARPEQAVYCWAQRAAWRFALFSNAPAVSHDCYSLYWFAFFMCLPCRKCTGDKCCLLRRHYGSNNNNNNYHWCFSPAQKTNISTESWSRNWLSVYRKMFIYFQWVQMD